MSARRIWLPALALVLILGGLAVYASGLDDMLARRLIAFQREFQDGLAQALRALRAGSPGAVTGFLSLCFGYGFLHALGPGHGKALIAGYSVASRATLGRMVRIAALASAAQATVAVALIYAGVWLFAGARDRIEGLAAYAEPFAMIAIAGLGLMLAWRGARRLGRAAPAPTHHHHDHDHHHHHHDETCGCGHAHAPAPAEIEAAQSWREVLALVAGIALRPCTGALFLLILTWRLGLDGLGILGAYVMAGGTFLITGLAALLAVLMRDGMRIALPEGSARLFALVEVLIGAVILVTALSISLRLL